MTHQQVAALHQGQAQVARQVGVLEIGFVVGAGREQRDVRIGPCGRALLDAIDQCPVGIGQALHRHGLKSLRKLARNQQAIFQQIAQTRGCFGALREHPPATVRPPRQVKGSQGQMLTTYGCHALHGVQITGVALHQCRGQHARLEQALRTVGVGHDVLEQAHALQYTGLNLLPAQRVHHQRQEVERPRALRPVGIGIDVVRDTVVAHLTLQLRHARRETFQTLRPQVLQERIPRRAERHHAGVRCGQGAVHTPTQFVPHTGWGGLRLLQQIRPAHARRRQGAARHAWLG